MIALLDELAAVEEIRQLKARYFRHLDAKAWDELGAVFTEDALFDLRAGASIDVDDGSAASKAAAHLMLSGRRTIVAAIRDATGDRITVHHGHCHEVTIRSRDEADGIIAMVDKISNRQTGACVLRGYGHYHDQYRREGREWRIHRSCLSRLAVHVDLAAR